VLLSALASVAGSLAACQAIIDLTDFSPSQGTDASADTATPPDASADAGTDAFDIPCPVLPDPSPEATRVDAAAFPPNFPNGDPGWPVFALHDIAFDVGTSGIDQDCRNTQKGKDSPCAHSPNDLDGGVDTAFNDAIRSIGSGGSGGDLIGSKLNAFAKDGTGAILLRIANTSSVIPPDALDVQVGFNSSPHLYSVGCGDAATGDGGPRWDGCDKWVAGTFYDNSDTRAWIVGGKVVARFARLVLNLGPSSVTLRDATVIADVVPGVDGGPATLTGGRLAGRVDSANALAAAVRYSTVLGTICNLGSAESLRVAFCDGRDLPASGRGSATETCTSLSFGMVFKATQVLAGGAYDGGTPTDPCPTFDAACP
jgi:hypothetical protein